MEDTILMAANHHELVKLGAGAGLSGSLVIELIKQFGPAIAKLLIDMLIKKKTDPKFSMSSSKGFDLPLVKGLLVALITSYRTDITKWLDDQENKLLDLIIAKLSE